MHFINTEIFVSYTTLTLMAAFQGDPGKPAPECETVLEFAAARDNGSGDGEKRKSKMCKAPIKSPLPTHQHSVFTGSSCHPTKSVQNTEDKNLMASNKETCAFSLSVLTPVY